MAGFVSAKDKGMMAKKPPKPAAPAPGDSETAQTRQRAIGERLQTFFDSVVEEGVPDDFEALLNKLEADETGGDGTGANKDGGAKDGGGE